MAERGFGVVSTLRDYPNRASRARGSGVHVAVAHSPDRGSQGKKESRRLHVTPGYEPMSGQDWTERLLWKKRQDNGASVCPRARTP